MVGESVVMGEGRGGLEMVFDNGVAIGGEVRGGGW